MASDHKAVRIDMKLSEQARGPGSWELSNSLLDDDNYVKLIEDNYGPFCEKYSEIEDKKRKWE